MPCCNRALCVGKILPHTVPWYHRVVQDPTVSLPNVYAVALAVRESAATVFGRLSAFVLRKQQKPESLPNKFSFCLLGCFCGYQQLVVWYSKRE